MAAPMTATGCLRASDSASATSVFKLLLRKDCDTSCRQSAAMSANRPAPSPSLPALRSACAKPSMPLAALSFFSSNFALALRAASLAVALTSLRKVSAIGAVAIGVSCIQNRQRASAVRSSEVRHGAAEGQTGKSRQEAHAYPRDEETGLDPPL